MRGTAVPETRKPQCDRDAKADNHTKPPLGEDLTDAGRVIVGQALSLSTEENVTPLS
jgi:hypothetical protein